MSSKTRIVLASLIFRHLLQGVSDLCHRPGPASRQGCCLRLIACLDFDCCLSTPMPVLTTSTYVAAWPQGDQFLGHGPPAQWLSLPFYTSEGAWPLSQSTWVQRWGRGSNAREGAEPPPAPTPSLACCPGEGRTRRTPRFVSKLDHLCLYQANRPRALLPPLPVFVCFSAADSV